MKLIYDDLIVSKIMAAATGLFMADIMDNNEVKKWIHKRLPKWSERTVEIRWDRIKTRLIDEGGLARILRTPLGHFDDLIDSAKNIGDE